MRLRSILRLLLAGLLAPWPGGEPDTPHLSVGYRAAQADGPNDWPFLWKGWPMFGHDLAQRLT